MSPNAVERPKIIKLLFYFFFTFQFTVKMSPLLCSLHLLEEKQTKRKGKKNSECFSSYEVILNFIITQAKHSLLIILNITSEINTALHS